MDANNMFCPKCGWQDIQADGGGFVEAGEWDASRGAYEYEWDGSLYRCRHCSTVFVVND